MQIITAGHYHTCALGMYISTGFYFLECWGSNLQQQNDIPKHIWTSQVAYMVAGPQVTCVQQKGTVVKCWGGSQEDREQGLQSASGLYLNSIEFNGEGDIMIAFGSDHTVCAVKNMNLVPNSTQEHNATTSTTNNINTDHITPLNPKHQLNFLSCWGKCANGLCTPPPHLQHGIIHVSVGHAHACAIKVVDDYYNMTQLGCWGDWHQSWGQSQVPDYLRHQVTAVSAGRYNSCAMKDNLFIVCWGRGFETDQNLQKDSRVQELNLNINDHSSISISKQKSLSNIPPYIQNQAISISAGGRHSCGIKGGELTCLGECSYGQCDSPLHANQDSQVAVVGWDQTCVLNLLGEVYCYGLNWLGQTDVPEMLQGNWDRIKDGGGSEGDSDGRRDQNNFTKYLKTHYVISKVVASLSHSCLLYSNRQPDNTINDVVSQQMPPQLFKSTKIVCWGGHNESGQLSIPNIPDTQIEDIAVGDEHTCILSGDAHTCVDFKIVKFENRLDCFGNNNQGQTSVPFEQNQGTRKFVEPSAGTARSCVIDAAKSDTTFNVVCWGLLMQSSGKVDPFDSQRLIVGELGTHFQGTQGYQLSVGYQHECVIGDYGLIKCVGENEFGQCKVDGLYLDDQS